MDKRSVRLLGTYYFTARSPTIILTNDHSQIWNASGIKLQISTLLENKYFLIYIFSN
jgi:hypothetical protein